MLPLTFLALVLMAPPVPAESWPGFRGDGSGLTTAHDLPLTWSSKENIAWRVDLPGYGQSSPVVWNGHIYLTAIDGPEKEKLFVVALDAKTGKHVWLKEFTASRKGKNNPMMSRAAPTPVVDADGVYVLFESGDLFAFTHTGEKRWHRSLADDHGEFKNNHGLGSSPAQDAQRVFIQVDHFGPSYLLAVDKKSGKDLWKAERPQFPGWTSPVVADWNGQPAVIASGGSTVIAYDVATGKELARLDGLTGLNIPSVCPLGNLLAVGAGENRMKPDLAASARSNCLLRLGAKDGTAFETLWGTKKVVSGTASPVIHGGFVYFVSKSGFVHCLDLKTGEEKYAERLDDNPWATPIVAGDYIYFFGKSGVTTVLKTGPEFDKVATNRLWTREEFEARLAEAKKQAAATLPPPPEGKGPGGGPPLPKEELEAVRYSAVGDVVYGVAAINRAFYIRTGTQLICVRILAQ
jgi:outer membrane protein assembly factor BamB